MLTRTPDWPEKLADYIHKNLRTPFKWGSFDCCLFACGAVLAITGTDLAADFRGQYNDLKSAYAAVKNYAGGGIAELVDKNTKEHGMVEVPVAFASRGDIVLVTQAGGDTIGIVGMDGIDAMCVGELALTRVPRKQWIKVWKV